MATKISEVSETATIYEDRTNPFFITLEKNDVALSESDMVAITKYEIRYDDTYYDSDDYPDAFSVDNATATVTVKPYALGLASSPKRGEVVEIIIYDTGDNANGLVWDQFALIVKEDANVPPTS